jgi:hypothetical protein
MEETSRAQERALLSDESSAGSDDGNAESRLGKSPSTATSQSQIMAADIARERHDLFNLVALVRNSNNSREQYILLREIPIQEYMYPTQHQHCASTTSVRSTYTPFFLSRLYS